MDRLEIAQKKYERIAARLVVLDEQKSDELEGWLREDVMPVVADLQRDPVFRRYVTFGISRLAAETDTRERLQVVAVSDAMVDCAAEVKRLGQQEEFSDLMTDWDPLEDLNQRKYGISPERCERREQEQSQEHGTRCIAEKMADHPWFDLVMDLDFPYLADHLYVPSDDSSFDKAFEKFRPNIPVLGDGVTRMMFARIDFWMHHLQAVWNRVLFRIMETSDDPHNEYEQFFMTKHRLDRCLEELRATCFSGDDPRMRDACCTLMQVYIAYHPRPQLPWLGLTEDRYQEPAGMLALQFRRLGELIEYEQADSTTIRESGRRIASIVDMDAIQRVVAALEDVAELYRRILSPEEMINEARAQYRLVVVTKPRMAFFDGDKLNVEWNRKSRPWELLRYLAAKGERLDHVDRYSLSGGLTPGNLSTIKHRLCNCLMDSGRSAGAELATRIESVDGEVRIDLAPNEIKVVDLEGHDADEWTVDPSEFDTASV